jgi:hypothetical protein
MQRIGLYYPYVHFASDSWVKAAALYWLRLARIIPPNFVAKDSAVVRELSEGLNFVVDLDPTAVVDEVSGVLAEVIRAHGPMLRARYGLHGTATPLSPSNPRLVAMVQDMEADSGQPLASRSVNVARFSRVWEPEWILDGTERRPDRLAIDRTMTAGVTEAARLAPFTHSELVGLHGHETTPELRGLLREYDLAGEADRAGWLATNPQLAWVYLSALAAQLAARNTLVPVTDEPEGQLASGVWDADRMAVALIDPSRARSAHDTFAALGLLALNLVVPQNLDQLPAGKIVELRRRYGAGFDAFHQVLIDTATDVREQLTVTTDPAVVQAYLDNEVRVRMEQPLAELRAALHGLKIDSALAAATLKFEIPALATIGGGLIAGNPVVSAAGTGAFALIAAGNVARQLKAARTQPSAASYLLHVGQMASPRRAINRVRRRAHGH